MPQKATRLTQRDIARLANVSQTTVSLVLNNRSDATARIPAETRDRVLKVIRETGYQADPLARRMLKQRNQILGVFTYESVFPSTSGDFYYPFLAGIEDRAERLGWDLLLFTSAPVADGHRRIFHENNRLRIADGCLLLGREVPSDELARLIAEDYPFVSVGRRDDAGAPVPSVGADYTTATHTIVTKAIALGHRHVAYAGPAASPAPIPESSADRLHGFHQAAGRKSLVLPTAPAGSADGWAARLLDVLLDRKITAVFVEERADAVSLVAAATARGIDVPGDLSVVALGDSTRPVASDVDFSGFHVPRRAMGVRAVELLEAILSGTATSQQILLPCELTEGTTLTPPKGV
ncbi:LacI family DNA-binding transcriptional regulator [Kribbella jiaozuonensis]|uniref:LacI family transcriptional regulator n=1 Tax=Kribbella jiaozuonensis TaxID=2575441 RepID=A0A4U3LUJ4_9ACTN|nr:LacI family DNA-binding transcriptional regulator [Kribbella jiaozuonensis]TKK78406.1 LacI family transcriptional regulator [Kribbella jiaozuonensis]